MKPSYAEIKYLVKKELLLEFRQKYALGGIFLYVASTVFICYLSFRNIIDPPTWNALLWIIILFGSINAVGRSFIQDSRGKQLYYYSLSSAESFILSRVIYNALILLFLSLVSYLCYSLFINNLVKDSLFFFISLIIGSLGFSTILTMISAIASKSNNNFTLVAILSFPLLIPLLITLIKVSKYAVDGLDRALSYPYFAIIIAINIIILALTFILFPYLWRE